MERMTGIDPMFIYSDTPETPMEIAYACVFDPTTAEGGYTFERVTELLEARIPGLPPFRRRLMTVPLGLDHPRWVDDPDFDLDNHLHRVALPTPGGDAEFTAMVAEVMGRPLTPGQPPWEMHVIERLAGGMIGLIAKVHHSVIDGVAGAELLAQLLDLTPEGRAVTAPCPPWLPTRLPSQTRLMSDALPSVVNSPLRALRAAREVGRTAVRMARCAVDDRVGPLSIPLGAPATFETPVGARRAVSFAELDMAAVRALKDRYGSTINDVVLAVCSGALRAHLAAHDQEVDSPLVAVVPVSVRGDEHRGSRREPALRDVRAAGERPEDAARAPPDGDRDERLVQGPGARRRVRPRGHPPGRGRAAGTGQADDPVRRALGRPAQAACRQPHDLERARAVVPPLFRGHEARGGVPARTRDRWGGAQHHRAELPRVALRRYQRLRDVPCRICPASRGPWWTSCRC